MPRYVTPRQAAEIINCSAAHVRWLIRKGHLSARRVSSEDNQHGYRYLLTYQSVKKYANLPQLRGFPRGKRRT
jgi:hypothetical protein